MRLYPVWQFAHEGPYQSVYDALLAVRHLTPQQLAAGPEALHRPELLTDLSRAATRLVEAIRRGEKIVVFGDYDVDGISSTAVLLDFLEACGARCDYILPDRHSDGYGIKPAGLRRALEKGADLIVTVDNGISAFEALELAKAEGIDVIVIDHHTQTRDLPPAHSIVNPNRRDCDYPFKGLAGVGVSFKVVQALSEAFMDGGERRGYLNSLLDLVALGTVADVASVLDENRVLVRHGLKAMTRTKRAGLRSLKQMARCDDGPIDTTAIGFRLGPRLNSAGRLASPDLALELLRTSGEERAQALAEELDDLNKRRQQLQRKGAEEANALVSERDVEEDCILVVLGEDWNLGVIGLIASALAERHYRPAIACTDARRDGTYVGSARSIPPYDMIGGISTCANHLTPYGGHHNAAGFSLEAERFEAFRVDLIDHAKGELGQADLSPRLAVDLALKPEDIGWGTRESLSGMEPFGPGNEAPVFAALDMEVLACNRVGKQGEHRKLVLEAAGRPTSAMWWRRGAMAKELRQGDRIAVAFELEADDYTGGKAVQMVIRDLYQVADPNDASGAEVAQAASAMAHAAAKPVNTGAHSGGASQEFQF